MKEKIKLLFYAGIILGIVVFCFLLLLHYIMPEIIKKLLKLYKMLRSEFFRIKLTATKPSFKDLIGLNENCNASFIIDFCTYLHPNQSKISQGAKVNVHTSKSHFIYTLYDTCILKTNVYTGAKIMYKL